MADSQKALEAVVTPAAPVRPEEYDTATRAALDHIDHQALRTVADGRPERTRKGYAQDWASWSKFCAESGVPLLAVALGTLVMFVEWLWTQPGWKKGTFTAPSTIDRRISGTVVSARAEHGLKLEDGIARLARGRLKQLIKEMEANGETRGRGQAPPPLVDHLVAISAACPDNLMGIRDRALVLMHFAVAGRDLAANRIRDYTDTPAGIQADMRVAKIRPRVVPVPYGTRPSICPVRAWQAWKDAAGLDDPDGYAWRRLHSRWHTVMEGGLQPESIGDVITRAGERAGIEIRFTGHSPRRLLATSSRLKGHDQIVIARQGGWAPHSKVLAGYLEVVDQWEDNALLGVL
ncbi:integrase [Streptomyces sp. ISL-22]|uniref:integrase n=1 Tax=unclassified Streptomyces TaxID=2593676 RepID=UPI001BE8D178|nr:MULTISPECIES: integrase [unclassified Streptomyces]MBT2423453.1 integrase [Streptomyces sp. ISL-24]MBT2438404.1 integrase [Streptomyces sp. ISL-22]